MVIWRITGNEIGPNGNGAAHFPTKAEADQAWRDWLHTFAEDDEEGRESQQVWRGSAPHKLVVKNREQLAALLDDAMGYGAT